jgi:AcrR family transcriptional regulator
MAAAESTGNGTAWDQRRIQMSLRIERAGLELLCERGLDDVTVEQMARAADISVRTFFRYFRNTRDVLTAVPRRESRRMCHALLARPAGESLLDGFHVWFRDLDHGRAESPTGVLEGETFALWSTIVREAPARVQSESDAMIVLSGDLEEVVRRRLGFGPGEDEKVGVLSAVFAAVIWYVYTRSLVDGDPSDLMGRLDQAFDLLGHLQSVATV